MPILKLAQDFLAVCEAAGVSSSLEQVVADPGDAFRREGLVAKQFLEVDIVEGARPVASDDLADGIVKLL